MFKKWSATTLTALLVAAVSCAVASQIFLQQTFAQVRHPESLFVANTTASSDVVRSWYRQLEQQGTFDQMVRTETVDFLWIAALTCSVVLLTLLFARLLSRVNPVASRRLYAIAPWAALGPLLDVAENTVSLVMLSYGTSFPDFLAPLHAGVSWVKMATVVLSATLLPLYTAFAAIQPALLARSQRSA